MAKHTLIAYVEDVPGVLNRVASLFRRRNFNIESLTVGRTESAGVSRLTVVVDASEAGARIVEANLYKLVNVLRVDDLTHKPALTRELGLVKVRVTTETRSQVLELTEVFRARVVDVDEESVVIEVTGTPEKIASSIAGRPSLVPGILMNRFGRSASAWTVMISAPALA